MRAGRAAAGARDSATWLSAEACEDERRSHLEKSPIARLKFEWCTVRCDELLARGCVMRAIATRGGEMMCGSVTRHVE